MVDSRVLIVGGGPVAMTAALRLAGFGVRSVMLEAKPERDPVGSKALCMQRDVLDVLDRVGAAEPLVDEGVTWQLGRTYYRDHELFRITFPDPGNAHFPPFVNIGQDRTEHWLERAVARSELTEIRYDHQVTGIADHGSTVEVEVAGRAALNGDYLIAADGSRSTSRKALDIGFPGRSFDDQFLICDIRAQLPFSNERRFFFDPEWNPGRQVLIHPQADSVWRIDWQVPPDFDLDAEEANGGLDARIRRIVGYGDYEIVWMSVYRFHQRLAERFRVGRSFLAGDAAHIMAPFGARGLNSGIQDADNLAWKLAYVLNGWSPEGLLDTYETERRAAAKENLAVTTTTMRFLVPGTDAEWERRRRLLDEAVHSEQARGGVDSGKLAEPYWYLDSPLTTPNPNPASFPTEPAVARPVVPGVLCPDLPCTVRGRPDVTRLRNLFGAGIAVLAADADAAMREAVSRLPGPVDIFDLDSVDPNQILRSTVPAYSNPAFVVRPDGHIAAIVDSTPGRVLAAGARAIGRHIDPVLDERAMSTTCES